MRTREQRAPARRRGEQCHRAHAGPADIVDIGVGVGVGVGVVVAVVVVVVVGVVFVFVLIVVKKRWASSQAAVLELAIIRCGCEVYRPRRETRM